uniref:Restriction endonuclease n=1 Tax=viral metagenome TaxID=1070528 RepID=A0A6C0C2M3_9ZZZZ
MSSDPKTSEIKKICKSLVGCKIKISFKITLLNGTNHSGEIDNCNIIGNCMEDILYPFISERIPTFEKGPPGQKPDFINLESETISYDYELKCFNKERSPGFDIGSITGFLGDISKPNGVQKKLSVKYLIFEYDIDKEKKGFTISDFWMLSVYNICCGYGGEKPINIGGQKGVNIRPATKNQWTDEKSKEKRNPTNFLDRIEKLIQSKWYKVHDSEKQLKLESIQTQRNDIGF